MSLVTQKVSNLLNGVSQRPPTQRQPSQAEEQINALSSLARGVMKRPPSRHVGKLTSDVTGWDDAFVHIINRDEDERYHVVIADGTLKIFDAVNGVEVPVTTPDGTAYLTDSLGKGFRAVTVGDTTIIVNRGVTTSKGTTATADAIHEALVHVRQSDFSTLYAITIDDRPVSLRTLDQDTPASRQGISTEAIATDLHAALSADATLSVDFTFTLYGSTIHIIRNDGADFTLAVTDGLADSGLKAVKSEVQAFDELPARAKHGFIVQVTGQLDTAKDNFFVQYDDLGQPGKNGIWRECPKPGTIIDFNPATMPHRLALRGEVAVTGKPHEGPPTNIASYDTPVPTPANLTWDSYLLSSQPFPAAVSTHRTLAHGGGADILLAADADYFVVPNLVEGLSNLELFDTVYARLYKNGVQVDEIAYTFEVRSGNEQPANPGDPFAGSLVAPNVSIGDTLSIRLEYPGGETNPYPHEVTLVFFNPRTYDGFGRTVTILPTHTNPGGVRADNYPVGSVFTFTHGADTFSFTVADEAHATPSAIATGLAAAIDASSHYTSSATANAFTFEKDSAIYSLFTVTVAYPALTFHNDALNLDPAALVGSILHNLTDGSSGVITANTRNTITVASFTGGADNLLQNGDGCSVFNDPDEGTHFVFSQIPWRDRMAGDTDVVTFPSFIDSAISDVFFYQNRIGFLSKENIVLSSSGDLFNLFRYTATDLRPDDCIDVRSAHADVTIFDSAFLWSGGLYVKSDNVWFGVSGEPALTPSTIRLDPVGRYPSSKDPRPVVVAERAFFTRAKSGNTQVFEIVRTDSGTTSESSDVTKEIPTYIQGSPVAMVGDSAEGFLALLTSADGQQNLHIYSWLIRDGQKVISSWSRWEFAPGTRILAMDMADGVLGFIRKQADGAYFEQIDLDLTPLDSEVGSHLDRRVESDDGVFGTGKTVFTLPYAVPVDGSAGAVSVVHGSNGTVYTTTRESPTTVTVPGHNLTGVPVYIGQPYEWTYEPTTFFQRDPGSGLPETGGRLQLRWLEVFYRNTTNLTITVSPAGRTPIDYTVEHDEPTSSSIKIPILCRNIDVGVVFTDTGPGPAAISELDWEGWYTNRSRRV